METRYVVIEDPDGRYSEGDIGIVVDDPGEEYDGEDCHGHTLLTMEDGVRWWFPDSCIRALAPEGCIIVSSLDYINNTELSDDDKEIIRTAIQSW